MIRDWPAQERRIRQALAACSDNPCLNPALGEALLGQGQYAEGFRLLRHWWDVPEARAKADMDFPIPRWRGEDLAGKRFLVSSIDGLGDQIMFARFARMLSERGADVHWLCPPPLVRLLGLCLAVTVIPGVGQVQLGHFDFFSTSSDLAELFFPPLVEPPGEPYLKLPPPSIVPGLRIGVVTHGNPIHANDGNRSLPAFLGEELLRLPGAVDLKPENTCARDLYDTACIIAGLDLVITVDTSVAHLAGALGRSVWVLVPCVMTDWRWGVGGEATPWYRSMRLFRQSAPGNWMSVIEGVKRALDSR
jgi:hypothetical protein